jgi:hypothetical protein
MSKSVNTAPGENIEQESDKVHSWRVDRLTALGVARPVAEAVADRLDWHEVAKLVERGCPASLAVTIVQ